tara:strand:+ start:42 stop:626 length:585 start_codon:yes stop_codon:yes gene_type:complete
MKQHPKYSGYFVTEEGNIYRLPVKGERMPINNQGLVYIKPFLRGHPKYPKKQYFSVNVTIRDENGKCVKQICQYNHKLVAETWVPNPEGHREILHIDENNRNNHYTNLKWGTHIENMHGVISPCTNPKMYKITDTITGKVWSGTNIAEWVRQNYDLIIPRMKSSNHKLSVIAKHLANARSNNSMIWKFKVEYGV